MNNVSSLMKISDRALRFRELCLLYCEFMRREGITLRPFLDPSLPVFSSYDLKVQDQILLGITSDLEIFESMLGEGHSLRDTPKLVWRYLHKLGLTPQSDIFDKITDDDIVEVYLVEDGAQRQVFRNLKFLECVSFTIDQIFGADWRVTTTRDEKSAGKILELAVGVMTEKITGTLALDSLIEKHLLQEVDSPELFTILIQIKYISPVKRNGKVAGAFVINHSEVVDRKPFNGVVFG
jgi:hypothetical protein